MTEDKRYIGVDIETFSSVDLKKCGVHRYVESPDFEILLISVCFDKNDTPVVFDLTGHSGLDVEERLNASGFREILTNPRYVKTAWNASFEITCLSKWLGVQLPFEQWVDTMVVASTLGLPRGLGDAGKALGLGEEQQKIKEGKALVKYFCTPCKPTKANGGRTRNLPEHAPNKWHEFVEYNRQDVVAERAIRLKLEGFPLSEEEHAAWVLDQEINQRGVGVDMEFVHAALRMNEEHSALLDQEQKDLTGLTNPNSVVQLKGWLGHEGSLDKKTVAKMKKDASGDRLRALEIRQELGKSSIAKYTAAENYCCEDNRVRGMFQFYGASRTGRWCLTGDHEVLTDSGWVRLDEWAGGSIACWNPASEIVSFQQSKALSFFYDGPMYHYQDSRIDQISTPDHKMRFQRRYGGEWVTDTVATMSNCRPCIPFYGHAVQDARGNSKNLRVLVMVQADGHFTESGAVRLRFKKDRKVQRCKKLLREAGIEYTFAIYDGAPQFTIPARKVPLWLRMFSGKTFGPWLFDENADVFFEEIQYWDGYRAGPNSTQYVTTNRANADMVQAFAHLTGRSAVIKEKKRDNPEWSTAYYVDICDSLKNCHEIRVKPKISEYVGGIYCAETPTGFFLVRRGGRVWVTGNSGRGVQLQNLAQNHIPDLAQAREMVKRGDREGVALLYDSVPDTLSQLIRTMFVPREGHTFAVADFAAIEARVIAWLADEQWRQEVFSQGGDIYCASASQMFHVPVVKHGVNGHLRQKGKIAELALGYGGGVGALTAMGALDMGLTEEELPDIVKLWRQASPRICDLWWAVGDAVINAVKYREHTVLMHGIEIWRTNRLLHIQLPSGRALRYYHPQMTTNKFGGESVKYQSYDAGKWGWAESYGPKFVENIVQGIARDCLRDAMLSVAKIHPDIVMHIHDEMVVEVPTDFADRALKEISTIMGWPILWAPGLLLRGDGYLCDFYMKD